MSLSKSIISALNWEEKRKSDLAAGNLAAVRHSYQQQKVFLPDNNRASFWDQRFAEETNTQLTAFTYLSPLEKWRIEKVLANLNFKQSVLNLGVGSGRLEARLIAKIKANLYTGTDITRQTLTKLCRVFPQFCFQTARLDKLPFKKASFQQILLLEVLEHIRPNKTFLVLKEIRRVLKTGGRLFISVPANEGLEKMLPINPSAHQRLYSLALLKFELEESGFIIKKIYAASAFAKLFYLKHLINRFLKIRETNNYLLIVEKKGN